MNHFDSSSVQEKRPYAIDFKCSVAEYIYSLWFFGSLQKKKKKKKKKIRKFECHRCQDQTERISMQIPFQSSVNYQLATDSNYYW